MEYNANFAGGIVRPHFQCAIRIACTSTSGVAHASERDRRPARWSGRRNSPYPISPIRPTRQARNNKIRARRRATLARSEIPGEAALGGVGLRCDQSLVAARDRSFQSAPCFCQFIRMWSLLALFLPSAIASLSLTQVNRTIAAGPTTRILGL